MLRMHYICTIRQYVVVRTKIPEGRVLVIGIDGVRPDALEIADTPAIDELISKVHSQITQKFLVIVIVKTKRLAGLGGQVFSPVSGQINMVFTIIRFVDKTMMSIHTFLCT